MILDNHLYFADIAEQAPPDGVDEPASPNGTINLSNEQALVRRDYTITKAKHYDPSTLSVLEVYLDTGSPVSLVSQAVFEEFFGNQQVFAVYKPIFIRIAAHRHTIEQCLIINMRFKTSAGRFVAFTARMYLLPNLSYGALLGNDILYSYSAVIDVGRERLLLGQDAH